MTNLNRLSKLERAANEHRRQRKQKPLTDYSHLTDEELNSLYKSEMVRLQSEPSPEYEGMTDQQLSDLYMLQIKSGNDQAKKSKKVK